MERQLQYHTYIIFINVLSSRTVSECCGYNAMLSFSTCYWVFSSGVGCAIEQGCCVVRVTQSALSNNVPLDARLALDRDPR